MSYCSTGCCTSRWGRVCFQPVPHSWCLHPAGIAGGTLASLTLQVLQAPGSCFWASTIKWLQSITCLGKHIFGVLLVAAVKKKTVLLILICSCFFSSSGIPAELFPLCCLQTRQSASVPSPFPHTDTVRQQANGRSLVVLSN